MANFEHLKNKINDAYLVFFKLKTASLLVRNKYIQSTMMLCWDTKLKGIKLVM